MSPLGRVLLPLAVAGSLLLAACATTTPPATTTPATGTHAPAAAALAAASTSLRVVAVGDIACPPGMAVTHAQCRQGATYRLARSLHPGLVLTLGDHQYDSASLPEFRASYARSWGLLRGITRPTIGNHEYVTPQARGYYTYFAHRQPGPPGYYRVAANGWNVYVLNSNCGIVSCSAEALWLDRQMTAHPSRCSIITMHHPRFSSGAEHGNDPAVRGLWAVAWRHHNDLVLSGHDHDYERFRPMDAAGTIQPRRGMQELVVGTGGRNLYHLGTRKHGSVFYQARHFGVLLLTLRSGSYGWSYRTIDGTTPDSGSRSCV